MTSYIKGIVGYIRPEASSTPSSTPITTPTSSPSITPAQTPDDEHNKGKPEQQKGYVKWAASGLYSIGSTTVGTSVSSVKWVAGTTYNVGAGVVGTAGELKDLQQGGRNRQQKYTDVKDMQKERNQCMFCHLQHRSSTCYKFPTASARMKRVKELHHDICYSCLNVHTDPCKTFTGTSICNYISGKCCGQYEHRRYLCIRLGLNP
ncbi:unnamed protein product [Meganyctiphanes norvegica]|uniref:Uncharacterized protein n=1 Tax=Meganyctiphanes norvegica TaxID=48144 RepID=A0AAV2S9Q2_MEGNR